MEVTVGAAVVPCGGDLPCGVDLDRRFDPTFARQGQSCPSGFRIGVGPATHHASQAVTFTVERDRTVRDPGGDPAGDLDPAHDDVDPGMGVFVEAGPAQPDPAPGVFRPPVVSEHSRPAVEFVGPVADAHFAGEAGERHGALRFGLRQRSFVEPGGGEVFEGPRRLPHPEGPACVAARTFDQVDAQHGVADLDPAVPRHGELIVFNGQLLGERPVQRGIEEGEPERGLRGLAFRLLDGVPDPDRERFIRMCRAEVVRLVHPGALLCRGPARSVVHCRTLSGRARRVRV